MPFQPQTQLSVPLALESWIPDGPVLPSSDDGSPSSMLADEVREPDVPGCRRGLHSRACSSRLQAGFSIRELGFSPIFYIVFDQSAGRMCLPGPRSRCARWEPEGANARTAWNAQHPNGSVTKEVWTSVTCDLGR
jgi:hypothetical protein